jgi:hypothetical protein
MKAYDENVDGAPVVWRFSQAAHAVTGNVGWVSAA